MDPEFLCDGDHEHDNTVGSISWRMGAELNVNLLQSWIGKLMQTAGNDLYRYKGVLAVKGMQQKFVFQGVHMLFSGDFSSATWAEGEKRENCFVFIGKNLDKKALEAGFMACKVDSDAKPLRFKQGDLVQAFVQNGWTNAKILLTWNDGPTEGNPYRIELEDGKGTNVWGPTDEPGVCVRPRPSA